MTDVIDQESTIYLCPRWCDERDVRTEPHDPEGHFTHVGLAGDADAPRGERVDVVLTRDYRPAPHDVARTRVQMWADVDGRLAKVTLPPPTARSLARWLVAAADKAEGSPTY